MTVSENRTNGSNGGRVVGGIEGPHLDSSRHQTSTNGEVGPVPSNPTYTWEYVDADSPRTRLSSPALSLRVRPVQRIYLPRPSVECGWFREILVSLIYSTGLPPSGPTHEPKLGNILYQSSDLYV